MAKRKDKFEAFVDALNAHLDGLRTKFNIEGCGDEFADTFIRHSGNKVTLIFDGAGYDWLSHNCDFPPVGDDNRKGFEDIAEGHGFATECENSWSLGFYEN